MRLFLTITLSSLYSVCVSAFTNPIKPDHGPDPFMVYSNGYYHLMTTTGGGLQIARATSLGGLKNATAKVVWKDSTPDRCCNVCENDLYTKRRVYALKFFALGAPEIHNMDGVWYIYYTAGPAGSTTDNQRMHAVQGSSSDIWASTWSYAGRLVVPNRDTWGIDGTVMTLSSGKYWVYSSYDGDQQCLWI
ncbi:hypothetical protein FRC08_017984, partial [Ceratobasidium sp. 394]